jgi:hypothetical protein
MASKSIQILVNEIPALGRYGALKQSPRALPLSRAQVRDLTNEIIVTQKIGVTQSPYAGSFASFRMTSGGG